VLSIQKDLGEGFTNKSGYGLETIIRVGGAKPRARDAKVRLVAKAACLPSIRFRISIAYIYKKKRRNQRAY
jgi:hypothetical protein